MDSRNHNEWNCEGDALVKDHNRRETGSEPIYKFMIEGILRQNDAIAELTVTTGKSAIDLSLSVIPDNPQAASIELDIAMKNFVFLHFGKGTTFEIPPEGGLNLPVGQMEQIRLFIEAVVDGNFEERLLYSDDRLVSGTGVLHLKDEDVGTTWTTLSVALFRSKREEHIHYEPYNKRK